MWVRDVSFNSSAIVKCYDKHLILWQMYLSLNGDSPILKNVSKNLTHNVMYDCVLSKQSPSHTEEPARDNCRNHANIKSEYGNSRYYSKAEGEHIHTFVQTPRP